MVELLAIVGFFLSSVLHVERRLRHQPAPVVPLLLWIGAWLAARYPL